MRAELSGLPLIAGGRSLGARVACRTAAETGAVAVLCLAFPLQPPPRKGGKVSPSRLPELEAVERPDADRPGGAGPVRDARRLPARRTVVQVPGDHGLKKDLDAIADAVGAWLPGVVAEAAPAPS